MFLRRCNVRLKPQQVCFLSAALRLVLDVVELVVVLVLETLPFIVLSVYLELLIVKDLVVGEVSVILG